MCGIAGYQSKKRIADEVIYSMLESIKYRGPDSDGVWQDNNNNVVLGHKRLAILDLSESGYQPMHSHSDRYVITLNGEIYNYLELKSEIEAVKNINWKGSSDTEVLLELIELYGLNVALAKSTGMFAFALYDKLELKLFIARDRIGEKPLYYYKDENSFVFASELKPIMKFPSFKKEINSEALNEYLNLSYINHSHSIFENTFKVCPAHYIEFDIQSFNLIEREYWVIKDYAKYDGGDELNISYEDAIDELERLVSNSIKMQMRTDVPFGAFLSGGVDSSLVVALMQQNSISKINTFSIGFEDKKYDESIYAKSVAKHIGTNHTELILTNNDLSDVVHLIPKMYDEPFADSSQIPTYLVSKLAKEKVTVSLSGDAGDELFYGYNHYFLFYKILNFTSGIKKIPIALFIKFIKLVFGNKISILNKELNINNYNKILNFIKEEDVVEKYKVFFNLLSTNLLNDNIVSKVKSLKNLNITTDIISYYDLQYYLVNDILVKVDRAAMYNSLETRVPFLDKDVVEFSLRLPYNYKYRNNNTKAILRDVLYRYVPRNLIERKKQGFSIPIEKWLRNELKSSVLDLLSDDRILKQGIFKLEEIKKIKNEFYIDKVNRNILIWNLFIFQQWYEEYLT